MTLLAVVVILTVLVVSVGFIVSQSVEIERFSFNLGTKKPVRIVHISDTHFPDCFLSVDELTKLVSSQQPDCLVLTGDIMDSSARTSDISDLEVLFRNLSEICPCFMVIGNHEIGSSLLDRLVLSARENGVNVLLNEIVTADIEGSSFAFIGLSDGYKYEEGTFKSVPYLQGKIKILLSHRPEKLPAYASAPDAIRPELVFCGHAHGGIMRLGKASLYAPNQGLLPKYTDGLYELDGVSMIVSRGLGIGSVDFRTFNKYSLPMAEILPK